MRYHEGQDITVLGKLYRILVARNGKLVLAEVLPSGGIAKPIKRKRDGRLKRQTKRNDPPIIDASDTLRVGLRASA